MRTLEDLRSAFDLLERAADSYSSERDEIVADGPDDVIPLQSVRPSGRRRRRPTVWLTAAAALAVGGTAIWTATRDSVGQSGGGLPDGSPIAADQLTLPFEFDGSLGYQILDLTISGRGEVDIKIAKNSHLLMFVLWPKAARGQHYDHPTDVDINGIPGTYAQDYVGYSDVAPATSVPPNGVSASPSMVPSSVERKSWQRHVQWTYAPDRVATLQTLDPGLSADISADDLLRIARGFDFTRTTTVRSPFALDSAPGDFPLTDVWVDLGTGVKNLQGFRISSGWWVSTTYRPGRELSGYQVRMHGASGVEAGTRGVVATKVDGHDALWSPDDHMLSVDFGRGQFLDVLQYTWGPEPDITLAEAIKIAKLVRVTSSPNDPAKWFDAADAFPLGS
jgi:hypothetical protein